MRARAGFPETHRFLSPLAREGASGAPLRRLPQKLRQQAADRLGLLLLDPVAGAVDEAAEQHLRQGALLHPLEVAGLLVDAPVARAGDEAGGDVDGPAGEERELAGIAGDRPAAIPLEAALEAGAGEFAAIDGKLVLAEPAAARDRLRRRHLGRHGLGHAL